jgi:hypothetical protein
MKKRFLALIGSLVILAAVLFVGCGADVRPLPAARHTETTWNLRTSEALEAIAFLNALTGDPLAAPHYAAELRHFRATMTPEVEAALEQLAAFREETLRAHLSGFLMPFFLAGGAQSVADLRVLTADPQPIRVALQAYDASQVEINVYYGDEGWRMFEEIAPNLAVVFEFLEKAGFASYWAADKQQQVEQAAARMAAVVQGYNILPVIEQHLGFGLPSDQVTIFVIDFLWPYGHHLVGTSLATVPEDSGDSVLHTTIHELLHNPFNNTDPAFWKAADALKADPYLEGAFAARDPKFGYNRWPEYVAENAVRALEQRIGEDLGLGPRWTWREDGGMHTLACVLYTAMREEGFPRQEEGFQDFLRRTVAEDLLAAGHVEAQYGRVCRNR